MKTYLASGPMSYDGRQLRSHFAYSVFGVTGDSIVCFEGPCRVDLGSMVDLEDVKANAGIESPLMLHFVVEHFDPIIDLEKAVLRQRMLVVIAAEMIAECRGSEDSTRIYRRGDDLYAEDGRKLSVSIASRGIVSSSIHLGLNVRSGGAPVPTIGLDDLGVEARVFAPKLLEAYRVEMSEIDHARTKVRPTDQQIEEGARTS